MPPLEVRAYAQRVRGWQTGWLQCAFAPSPSLPARAQGHGGTSVSPPGVVVAVEEGEQQVPPLSSTGAVYPWRTARSLLLKAAPDAVETAEGHGVVLLLTFGQLLRKRDRCFHLPAGCPEGLGALPRCPGPG